MTNTNSTTTALDLTDLASVVDAWLVTYTDADMARRQDMIAQIWTPEAALVDPPFDGTGHEAISGMVDIVLTHYAGHSFRRTTQVDAHHTFARYGWEMVGPDGAVALAGTDIVRVDPTGKLAGVVGFFGPLQPA